MKILLYFGLLLAISTLRAQQPGVDCAPVHGQGWEGCAPINQPQQQAQPQPPPVRWADQWGAIATDNQLGKVGASTNKSNKSSAELTALNQCQSNGGAQCKVLISFYNQCGVMIIGDGKINANSAATITQASDAGIKTCSTATTNCHVYYSTCSLPVRIQ